jgi:glutamyl-tRNA synthetase
MNEIVRTRFAPSPTGFLHVGGVRTALFAWLLAKKHNGQFILRIEDTDQAREVEGSADHIVESLGWLEIVSDEAISFQSKRVAEGIYKEYAQKLIDKGLAYVDPYSVEQLQTFRDQAKAEKRPFLYRDHRPNSLDSLPQWDGTQPLRLKSNPKTHTWHDEVMGELKAGPEAVDDFIIMKSDGFPTYNFAHIIDDHLMNITHVIRSQEFLSSVPKYLNLYEALDIKIPKLATVPFVMGPDGKKKLSKRDGAKDILNYREEGYLPEAMINFLATLGWNDGTEQEIFTVEELKKKFDLSRVQKGGARFDEQRLLWLNGAHIRRMPLDALYTYVSPVNDNPAGYSKPGYWSHAAYSSQYDQSYRKQVLGLVQERMKFFAELPELTNFFFEDLPVDESLIENHKQLKRFDKQELKALLETSKTALEASEWTGPALQQTLNNLLEQTKQKPAVLFSLIRIATTQSPASPGLAETLALLGKERSMLRINAQLDALH